MSCSTTATFVIPRFETIEISWYVLPSLCVQASKDVVQTAAQCSPNSQPLAGWTVSKWEDLWCEIVLLKLTTFAQIPRPHRVVESSRPQLGAVGWDVYTAGAVSVPLELSANECHHFIINCWVTACQPHGCYCNALLLFILHRYTWCIFLQYANSHKLL